MEINNFLFLKAIVPVPNKWEAGWVSEPVRMLWRRKYFTTAGN
jgi:hypothetical protein